MRGWGGPRMPSRGALTEMGAPAAGDAARGLLQSPRKGPVGPDQQRFQQQPQVCPLASQARQGVSVLVQQLQETGQRPKQPSRPPPSSVGRTMKSRKAQVKCRHQSAGLCVHGARGLPAGVPARGR